MTDDIDELQADITALEKRLDRIELLLGETIKNVADLSNALVKLMKIFQTT
jgi:hypothetical protein